MTQTVGLLIFDGVEVLDACGPFEVFSVANRVAVPESEQSGTELLFVVTLVGVTPTVLARGGLRLTPDVTVDQAGSFDVVVVPGGVIDAVETEPDVLGWLRRVRGSAELVASVCNGAFILAAAGLLDPRPVTTHWADHDELVARYPDLDVRTDVRYVDHGDIATSAGVSAGIDLSLHLVERFAGFDVAESTARRMDYPWTRATPLG